MTNTSKASKPKLNLASFKVSENKFLASSVNIFKVDALVLYLTLQSPDEYKLNKNSAIVSEPDFLAPTPYGTIDGKCDFQFPADYPSTQLLASAIVNLSAFKITPY